MWLPWVKGTDSINFPSQVVFTEDASQTCRYLIARYYKYDETTVVDAQTGKACWIEDGKIFFFYKIVIQLTFRVLEKILNPKNS